MIFEFRKIIFQAKRNIMVLPLLCSLILPPNLYAFDGTNLPASPNIAAQHSDSVKKFSFFEKSCDAVYQFVNDHEYLLVPLSGAMAGLSACGTWCAAAGGLTGAIDDAVIYFGFTDKRYLTWGIFGLAFGHAINPASLVSEVSGIAVGILLPTGVLNDYPEFIAPAVSAIAGSQIGVLGSIVDELAIKSGVTDKHYMTFFMAGNKVATSLLGGLLHPAVSDFIGITLGAIAANNEEKVVANFLGPIKTVGNLYETYSKFIPNDHLSNHIEKQALALIGNQFMMQVLSLKLIGYKQNILYNFERLDAPNGPAWGKFGSEISKVAIFIIPYVFGQAVSDRIDSYFNKKLRYSLEDKVRYEFFSDETASRLSNYPNAKVLTDNLRGDISTITKSGSILITESVSTSIKGIHGFGIIVVTSPDMVAYSFLYNQVKSFISIGLATTEGFYEEKVKILDSEIAQTMQHASENIKTIAEMDGMNATKNRLQQLYDVLRDHETSQKQWNFISRLWGQTSGLMNFIINYYLVGREINYREIPFENRMKALVAGEQVSQLLSFSGDNAQNIALMDQSNNRIMVLEGIIHAQPNYSDQINRITEEGGSVIIQDLELGVCGKFLLSIKYLKLDRGKIYVLVGENGCGKSIFLSKIKGAKTNNISAKGDIHYPLIEGNEPKIVMVGSRAYFPLNSSLQQVVYWPDEIPIDPVLNDKKKKEMQSLLAGIKFLESDIANDKVIDLDSVTDWNHLSDGEKKKVMLVSAIIKEPDILLLDEIFAGLDPNARRIAQRMLQEKLPKALILVVDHEAQARNNEYFYNKQIKFSNKSVSLEEFRNSSSQVAATCF